MLIYAPMIWLAFATGHYVIGIVAALCGIIRLLLIWESRQ